MTFKPGQSGNPSGRPKENNEVKELARKWTRPAIARLAEIMRDKSDNRASAAAAMAILDRAWGKPVQQIEGDLANIIVNVIRYDPQVIDAVSREIAAETARIEAAE